MPATNPRISVTVQPAIDAVMTRLASLTGQSKSAIIAEMLESSLPIFERMVTVIEAAAQAKDTLKAQSLKDLQAAEEKLQGVLGLTMDIFDQGTLPILQEAESIRRRAGPERASTRPQVTRTRAQPAQPPLVTRGSGTPGKAKKAIERSKGKARG